MTNSMIEISEVEVQLPEWRVALYLNVWRYGETVAHAAFLLNTG